MFAGYISAAAPPVSWLCAIIVLYNIVLLLLLLLYRVQVLLIVVCISVHTSQLSTATSHPHKTRAHEDHHSFQF